MTNRRPARNQPIPPQEVEFLASLEGPLLYARVHGLYNAGWPLQAIGDCLAPPRPRTTISSWVLRHAENELKTVDAPTPTTPIPTPTHKTHPDGYQKKRPLPTEISQDDLDQIRQLAPLARQFRAKMAKTSAPAVANARLTALCIRLYQGGTGITELAHAAGVTYRAMYKRVKL